MNRNRNLARVATLGLVAAAVTLVLPASVFAQRGAGGGGFGQNPGMQLWMALDQRFDEFGKQLTLTETQTESVKKLLEEFTEKNASVSRLKDLFTSMRERAGAGRRGGGGGAGGGRGGAGMQGMQEMRTLMQDLGPAFEELHEKVTALLDEEQKKTLTTLLQRRRPGG